MTAVISSVIASDCSSTCFGRCRRPFRPAVGHQRGDGDVEGQKKREPDEFGLRGEADRRDGVGAQRAHHHGVDHAHKADQHRFGQRGPGDLERFVSMVEASGMGPAMGTFFTSFCGLKNRSKNPFIRLYTWLSDIIHHHSTLKRNTFQSL